jgi:hypothetical protein
MTTNADRAVDRDPLDILRDPFPAEQIGFLPKPVRRDDKDRGKCEKGSKFSVDGKFCGGYHSRSVHLEYVGHAALTARLLDVDPFWTWEPVAFDDQGLPALDRNGGLWIRLTVAAVTRLGYGDAQGKTGPNAVKEAIGDALRNAGMRFGAALDLWSKEDLRAGQEQEAAREWVIEAQVQGSLEGVREVWKQARAAGAETGVLDEISAVGTALQQGGLR